MEDEQSQVVTEPKPASPSQHGELRNRKKGKADQNSPKKQQNTGTVLIKHEPVETAADDKDEKKPIESAQEPLKTEIKKETDSETVHKPTQTQTQPQPQTEATTSAAKTENAKLYQPKNANLSEEPLKGHSYYIASWVFLRALAVIYVVTFISLWVEVHGLIGSEGISPVDDFIDRLRTGITERGSFFNHPTIFWLNASDTMIHIVCGLGLLASVLMFFDILTGFSAAVSWFLYLSLCVGGQSFTDMPWDHLLLECGFLAIFMSSFHTSLTPFSKSPLENHTPQAILYLFRLLLFRVHLARGLAEVLGKDRTWRTLSAFQYHFETQPSPTPLAYYLHVYAPPVLQFALVFFVLTVELGVVFLMFGPRLFRRSAAFYTAALQILFIATGNFGSYHWIILALCLLLLDDRMFPSLYAFLKRVRETGVEATNRLAVLKRRGIKETSITAVDEQSNRVIWQKRITILVAVIILLLTTVPLSAMTQGKVNTPEPLMVVYRAAYPFKLVNIYGPLNRIMPDRHEIVIQGSQDAHIWHPYYLRYKPDEDLTRGPQWVSPFISRLEYRLWMASTSDYQHEVWMSRLLHRLLDTSLPVKRLFRKLPCDGAPEFVRAIRKEYRFAPPNSEAAKRGEWWETQYSDIFTPSFSQTVTQMSQKRTDLRKKVSKLRVG